MQRPELLAGARELLDDGALAVAQPHHDAGRHRLRRALRAGDRGATGRAAPSARRRGSAPPESCAVVWLISWSLTSWPEETTKLWLAR